MNTTTSPTDFAQDELFGGQSYTIIPWFHQQELLFFREFGSYQGDWLMMSFDPRKEEYVVWSGDFGSCSGCDNFEGTFSGGSLTRGQEGVQKFVANYSPFLTIPAETMRNMLRSGRTIESLLPKNAYRDWQDDDDAGTAFQTLAIICKVQENIGVTARDIYDCANAEVRRRALERYGVEKWLTEMEAVQLHEDETGRLYQIGDRRYVRVQDASTEREFLLRVPVEDARSNDWSTARAAVAWTFGLSESEYQPQVQT